MGGTFCGTLVILPFGATSVPLLRLEGISYENYILNLEIILLYINLNLEKSPFKPNLNSLVVNYYLPKNLINNIYNV